MYGKLGRARSIITNTFDTKGNKNKGFLKDFFIPEIS